MAVDNNFERFERDGFIVLPSIFDDDVCSALLGEVVQTLSNPEWSYIHQSTFRAHCPLVMTPTVQCLLRTCVRHGHSILTGYLSRRQLLVELSSITVFPHAAAQPVHADENEDGKHIITAFVNLTPTERDVGALMVLPGSHRKDYAGDAADVLELSTGSVVFMSGKLKHAGTANTSVDRIRPVVYVSFGDDDILGPAYSMRSEYRGKFDVAGLFIPPPSPDSRPGFACRHWASMKIEADSSTPAVALMKDDQVEHLIQTDSDDSWIVILLGLLQTSPRRLTVRELSESLRIDLDVVSRKLVEFGDLGALTW